MKSKRSKATDISKAVKDKVWERDNHKCIICNSPHAMPNAHYISRARSGLGIEENIVTLCHRCHHEYDNGKNPKPYKTAIENYLKSIYENWNVDNLVYKKWS